jgi:hypothetical protein
MTNLTPFELFRIRFTGVLYAVVHFTVQRRFLGPRISSWLKFGFLTFTFAVWITRQPVYLVFLGLAGFVGLQFIYWYVRRQGYIRFIPVNETAPDNMENRLADNKRVKTQATGTFSVSSHEAYVLQRPAEYWRVPVGDHAIMVQYKPGKFLYQFVQAGTLQKVETGFLIFGRRPQEALAITFLTSWGPENAGFTPKQFMSSTNHTPAKLEQTIYLTFETAEARQQVHSNLLRDVGKPIHKAI